VIGGFRNSSGGGGGEARLRSAPIAGKKQINKKVGPNLALKRSWDSGGETCFLHGPKYFNPVRCPWVRARAATTASGGSHGAAAVESAGVGGSTR